MKRINVKLLLILVITVVVLSTGVAVVHAIQMNRNSESLLKRAETAKSSGDTAQAIFFYRRYLSYKQRDIERYADYALLMGKVAESPNATPQEYGIALKELQTVLLNDRARATDRLNDKSRSEVRHKLVQLEMETHQAQLMAAARTLLLEMKAKGETTPEDEFRLAQCQAALGSYTDSVKQLEMLIGYDPKSKKFDEKKAALPTEVEAYLTLANLLREKISDSEMSDRQDVADRIIEQMVKVNNDSVKAMLGRARYMQQYVSQDKAKSSVDRALQLAPDDADVLLQAAEMASKANDFNTAENLLKKGVAKYPQDERMYFAYAHIAGVQKNSKALTERLEAGLNAIPTSPLLLQMLFDQQLDKRDLKSARVTLQKLATSKYPPILKEFREAQLLTMEGNFLEASRRLEKLRPQLSKASENSSATYYVAQMDYLLMQCYLNLGLHDLALSTARRFAAESNSLEGELGIATALMALGKSNEAKWQFEGILKYLTTTNKQQAAIPQVCNALIQLRIGEQMRLPEESRDWDSVIAYIADLRQRDLIKEPTASLMQADTLAHKGDKQESRKILDRLAEQYPDNKLILNARVEMALQDRKLEEASRLIQSAPARLRDLSTYLSRIDIILFRDNKKTDKLQELESLGAEIEKENLSDADQAQVQFALSSAYRRLGDAERTVQAMNKAASLQPRDAQIHWRAYDLFRDTANTKGLKDLADWFGKEYGRESAQSKLADAAVLVTAVREEQAGRNAQKLSTELSEANKTDLRNARDMLRTVETLRPDWYERPKLLTEIDLLESKPDEAIIDLREVLRLGPPDPLQVRRLAQLLLMQKRYAEVKEVLDTYGTSANKGLERIEAVTEQLTGRPDLALQRLESLIPKDSTSANDHLYYGQMLAAAGKSEQAESEMRRATELAPQQPETWLALVHFLVTNGRREEARKTVQESQIQLPEDRRTLAIAQGFEIVGDQQLAEQYYKSALDAAPKDPKTQRIVASYYVRTRQEELAKPLIDELLKLQPSNSSEREILAWARRSAAQMLAAQGDYQSFLKAVEYLSPSPGETSSAADLSLRAFLLGSRPDVASARQALDALQELKNLRALSTDERLLLSQVYERTGNWGAVRDELLAMLNQPNAAATTYTMLIEMLIRRNAVESAVPWLQKLESFARTNPLLVATVAAHVASVQGNSEQAAARMMRLLPTERPLPKDKIESLHMVADLLTQMEQYDHAEKLWREYVEYNPDRSLELASFLAKRGKVDEALQLVEQRRKTDSAVMVLKVADAAARQRIHPLTANQIQQVEQWFQRAMRDDPDSVPLQILWADFLDSQSRYDEVEKVYRGVLARTDVPPKDRAGVANNLAFALAVRGHNLDEALKLSDSTVSYLGPIAEALDTRGLIYLAKGDTKQAIRDLTDAVSVLDPQAVTYFHLAMAQAAAKDSYSARHSLDRAQELKLNLDDLSPLDRKNYETLKEQLKKPS